MVGGGGEVLVRGGGRPDTMVGGGEVREREGGTYNVTYILYKSDGESSWFLSKWVQFCRINLCCFRKARGRIFSQSVLG